MAYSREIWDQAKVYFELGKSLNYISKTLNVNKSTISRRAKKEGWECKKLQPLKDAVVGVTIENATIEEKKATLGAKIATLNDYEVQILNDVVSEESGLRSLLFSTTALAVIRSNELLKKNKKTIMMKVSNYDDDGKRIGDDYEPYEVPLSVSDIKDVVESTDKASITLGINQRHANSQVTVNTQNNNTQHIELTEETVKKVIADFDNDY